MSNTTQKGSRATGSSYPGNEVILTALFHRRSRLTVTIHPDPKASNHETWGESVWADGMTAREWRAVVHSVYGPHDLHALGVDHPHLRWERAITEIHRARRASRVDVRNVLAQVRVAIEVSIVAAERGAGKWVSSEDLLEAALRLRGAV